MNKKQKREAGKAAKVKPVETATTEATPKVAKVKAVKEAKPGAMAAMPKLPKLPSASRARKPKPFVKCTCGCGGDTRSLWVPGHDARAKGWMLRIERGICTMKDVPENEQAGAKYMIKLRKELGTEGTITLVKGKNNKVEKVEAEPAAEAVNE